MKFAWILLFVSFAAVAFLGACTHQPLAGAYGSARGPEASVSHPVEMHPWCGGNQRQHFPQCGQGN